MPKTGSRAENCSGRLSSFKTALRQDLMRIVLRKPSAPARHSAVICLPEGLKESLPGKVGFCKDGFVLCAACPFNASIDIKFIECIWKPEV